MTSARKFSLLTGAIWNLKRWLESRQAARRQGDAIAERNATIRINAWRETAQKVRGL